MKILPVYLFSCLLVSLSTCFPISLQCKPLLSQLGNRPTDTNRCCRGGGGRVEHMDHALGIDDAKVVH